MKTLTIALRVAALPWPDLHAGPDARGFAQTPPVLSGPECRALTSTSRGERPDRPLGGNLTEHGKRR